jgi:hypothetical protein
LPGIELQAYSLHLHFSRRLRPRPCLDDTTRGTGANP